MSMFVVNRKEFVQALQCLEPFTVSDKEVEDSTLEMIHGNFDSAGNLALSVRADACFAVCFIPLVDFDGELTDFAIHRDEVRGIASQFRGKDEFVNLKVDVQHREMRVPAFDEKSKTKIERMTQLRFEEEGELFGTRVVALAGADGRSLDMRQLWTNIGSDMTASRPLRGSAWIDPKDFKKLSKASSLLGIPYISVEESGLMHARIGLRFYASIRLAAASGKEVKQLDVLGQEMLDAAETLPSHFLFVEDELSPVAEGWEVTLKNREDG